VRYSSGLKKLRTGRRIELIEHLKVDYYGSDVPLQQVAGIAVEDAARWWSRVGEIMVGPIEKAIHKSDWAARIRPAS